MLQEPTIFDEHEISVAAKAMQDLEITKFWQYRFSDTMAHYFEFLASTEEEPRDRIRFFDLALRQFEKAMELGGVLDQEVTRAYQRVVIARREATRQNKYGR